MPVIGRLDEQVDAILISPLGKRDSRAEASGRGQDAAREAGTTPPSHPANDGGQAAADDEKSGVRPQELPVWLL